MCMCTLLLCIHTFLKCACACCVFLSCPEETCISITDIQGYAFPLDHNHVPTVMYLHLSEMCACCVFYLSCPEGT